VDLHLNAEEEDLLRDVLSNYLRDLRSEIFHTEDHDLHELLKLREQLVDTLIKRLAA
jgi:hypothetical protein